MYVWLYVFLGCTRTCECDCDVVCGCVIYICCVGFASLDVVCDEPNDCAWNVLL